MNVLVLEASTVSAKATVFNFDKGIVSNCSKAFCHDEKSTAEHDPELVLKTVFEMGAQVAEGYEIDAIGCVCTGHSSMLMDKDMNPISPTYTWTYNHGSEFTTKIREDADLTSFLYHETGCMVHTIYPLYRNMYLRDILGLPVDKSLIVSEGSHIFYKLTGKRVESPTTSATSGFANVNTWQWSEALTDFSGISTDQFLPVESCYFSAPLMPEAAKILGVRAGTPVCIPVIDGSLNQLGAGMMDSGYMTMSLGTSGAMRIASDAPLLPDSMATWCYNLIDKYMCGATISGCTNCVDWFKRCFFPDHSYSDLENMIKMPGENSPVFLPFIFGERCPGWRDNRPGGFYNMRDYHHEDDMYTSILEGIAFNMYQNYGVLTELGGKAKAIHLSGGVLNSPKWTQMVTDIFGHEMITNTFEQIASVGAACMAFRRCGAVKSERDYHLPEDTVRIVKPDMERHDIYKKHFEKYLEVYNKV